MKVRIKADEKDNAHDRSLRVVFMKKKDVSQLCSGKGLIDQMWYLSAVGSEVVSFSGPNRRLHSPGIGYDTETREQGISTRTSEINYRG